MKPLAKKIGILGGGQLARMLCLKGHELGLNLHVLSEQPNDPAAQVTNLWQQGSYNQINDIINFLKKIDILTFESEFVDCNLLEQAIAQVSLKKDNVFPSIENMRLLQDRWSQKNLFKKYKIPTSDFFNIENTEDLEQYGKHFNFKYVLKKRFGGYDGYGTFISRNETEHKKILSSLKDKGSLFFIIEQFISFKSELACQFFRNHQGDFYYLPLVESRQKDSKCDWVAGPVKHPKFMEITKKIKNLMTKQNYVGALAFEFFNTSSGLLINESAPRVHNSGHYSLNYPEGDQFTLHLKSISSYKLPKQLTKNKFSFAMVNLIGESENDITIPKDISGFIHMYGKAKNRIGRKMGHINYIDSFTKNKYKVLLKKALKDRKKIKL
jgi:5-(carboxyamino)imidazole ribonucleotide synthase